MAKPRASKDLGTRAGNRALQFGANAKFELLVLALLLLTCAAIRWEDQILQRTQRISPAALGAYTTLAQTDSTVGGNSTITPDPAHPLHWSCDLQSAFAYPFCGYEVEVGGQRGVQGIDLSNLHSIEVTLAYTGPAKTLRFHLKNYDPRYSQPGVGKSAKFNKVEFPVESGKVQTVTLDLSDFSVADWWLRETGIAPKLGHPQFDNITSLDFQTGTDAPLGIHNFEVREIVLRKAALSTAQWYLLLLGFWVVLIGAFLVHRIRNLKNELASRQASEALTQRQAEEAEQAARHDHLTSVLNRRGAAERFAQLSPAGAVALILIDIDRFKMLNDRFGHGRGDDVLAAIATLIRHNVRAGDTVARWGGEEFLILCPATDEDAAVALAEQIRQRIAQARFGACGSVTASFGVLAADSADLELTDLVSLADLALYSAKRQGRNRVLPFRPEMANAA